MMGITLWIGRNPNQVNVKFLAVTMNFTEYNLTQLDAEVTYHIDTQIIEAKWFCMIVFEDKTLPALIHELFEF